MDMQQRSLQFAAHPNAPGELSWSNSTMEDDKGALWPAQLVGDALDHVITILPGGGGGGWSLGAQLLLGVLTLSLQQSIRGHRRFSDLNEFLCTFLWVALTLESTVIGLTSSSHSALFNLFLRMLVWPSLSFNAAVNPLNSIYAAVIGVQSTRQVTRQVFIQLVAMTMGLAYTVVSWRLLSTLISESHLDVMSSHVNPFLTVGFITGFLLELGMSFAMYLPRLAMGSGFKSTFVSSVLVCVMITQFESWTGAFMNPLVALSFNLLWHHGSFSFAAAFEMMFVYWLGPVVGTYLIASLEKMLIRHRRKTHIS